MSNQLRAAIDAAAPDELEKVRGILLDAADLAELASDPEGLLYRTLIDDLDHPAPTYRPALSAACMTAGSPAVAAVVGDLLSIGAPLTFALARELGAAARWPEYVQQMQALGERAAPDESTE